MRAKASTHIPPRQSTPLLQAVRESRFQCQIDCPATLRQAELWLFSSPHRPPQRTHFDRAHKALQTAQQIRRHPASIHGSHHTPPLPERNADLHDGLRLKLRALQKALGGRLWLAGPASRCHLFAFVPSAFDHPAPSRSDSKLFGRDLEAPTALVKAKEQKEAIPQSRKVKAAKFHLGKHVHRRRQIPANSTRHRKVSQTRFAQGRRTGKNTQTQCPTFEY